MSCRVPAPLVVACVAWGASVAAQAQEASATAGVAVAPPRAGAQARYRLRAVRVEAQDVFRPEETGQRVVPRALNALHATTRRETVLREVFVQPGELVDESQAEELERNLRALGIFAEVEVTLVPATTDGEADLVVRTRDRFTLAAGGGASYVGGTTGFNVSASESNVLGNGDRIAASFRESDDGDFRGVATWQDLHLFDTWMRNSMRVSRTDDGDGFGVEVDRPIKHLRDPRSWRVAASYDELAQDYYEFGEEEGSVPFRRTLVEGEVGAQHGERFARSGFGFTARALDMGYGEAEGALAPTLRVPGATRSLFLAPTFRGRWIDGFRTATAIDTLGFVQDIALATEFECAAGGLVRDEDGLGTELQPAFEAHAGAAWEPRAKWLLGIATDGGARWGESGLAGWRATARAQSVWLWRDDQALCGTVRFDAAEEDQDLPVQFTLGADSGLRGYDSRLLEGRKRVVASVEERCDTGLDLWAFRVGLAAFGDAGWITDGPRFGRPYLGVGGGLRIGSAPLLGANVLRMDFATALDDADGNTDGPEFSVTVGQAFTFGGASRIPALR